MVSLEDSNALSKDEKRKSLLEVKFIRDKICGIIRRRTCTEGMPQRNYISREEATSSTISIERLFAYLIIDAHNGRAL